MELLFHWRYGFDSETQFHGANGIMPKTQFHSANGIIPETHLHSENGIILTAPRNNMNESRNNAYNAEDFIFKN